MLLNLPETKKELEKIFEAIKNSKEKELLLFSILSDLEAQKKAFLLINNTNKDYAKIREIFNFNRELIKPSYEEFLEIAKFFRDKDKELKLSKNFFTDIFCSYIELNQYFLKAFVNEFNNKSLIKDIVKIHKDMYNALKEK